MEISQGAYLPIFFISLSHSSLNILSKPLRPNHFTLIQMCHNKRAHLSERSVNSHFKQRTRVIHFIQKDSIGIELVGDFLPERCVTDKFEMFLRFTGQNNFGLIPPKIISTPRSKRLISFNISIRKWISSSVPSSLARI